MLFLVFYLDRNRYLLDTRQVVEILPLVDIMDLPHSLPGVAGIFNYRGTLIPAVDLSQIVLGRPALRRLHTRIVLVRHTDEGSAQKLLGLIVERVTDTRQIQAAELSASGISASRLGPVISYHPGLAQRIEIQQFLPASACDPALPEPPSCR